MNMQESKTTPKVLVLHGPNLNMLGGREPSLYGTATLEQIDTEIRYKAQRLNMEAECFQSNYEGALVEKIQGASGACQAVVINPAALTHTSVAVRDALLLLDVPIIEVHLSNIYKREPFRHFSYVADIATARVAGFGKQGYLIALEALARMMESS
jgi:3-dehydroquinate dehydratase-2